MLKENSPFTSFEHYGMSEGRLHRHFGKKSKKSNVMVKFGYQNANRLSDARKFQFQFTLGLSPFTLLLFLLLFLFYGLHMCREFIAAATEKDKGRKEQRQFSNLE